MESRELQIQNHKQWLSDPQTRRLIAKIEEDKSRHLRLAVGKAKQSDDPKEIISHLLSYDVCDNVVKEILNPHIEAKEEETDNT